MTEALKDLIDKAKYCPDGGYFNNFLIVPTDEEYDGFWGKNGYNNIIILAYNTGCKNVFRISPSQCDVFSIVDSSAINMDVPENLGCLRLFTNHKIHILSGITSAIMGYEEVKGR